MEKEKRKRERENYFPSPTISQRAGGVCRISRAPDRTKVYNISCVLVDPCHCLTTFFSYLYYFGRACGGWARFGDDVVNDTKKELLEPEGCYRFSCFLLRCHLSLSLSLSHTYSLTHSRNRHYPFTMNKSERMDYITNAFHTKQRSPSIKLAQALVVAVVVTVPTSSDRRSLVSVVLCCV